MTTQTITETRAARVRTRFVIQYLYRRGQVGSEKWGWQDFHKDAPTFDGAVAVLAAARAEPRMRGTRHHAGKFRIVKRTITVTEEVCQQDDI